MDRGSEELIDCRGHTATKCRCWLQSPALCLPLVLSLEVLLCVIYSWSYLWPLRVRPEHVKCHLPEPLAESLSLLCLVGPNWRGWGMGWPLEC